MMIQEEEYRVVIEYRRHNKTTCKTICKNRVNILLKRRDFVRGIVIDLMNTSKEPPYHNYNMPIILRLKNDGSKQGADFGIRYALNKDGSLKRLGIEKSTQYNWTYGEILMLKDLGIINGNTDHIIIEFPEGLGAAGGSGLEQFCDLVQYIELLIATYKGGLGLIQHIKTKKSVKRIRKNGFDNPRDIREVIERKDNWSLRQIKKLFQMDTVSAVVILMSYGFVEKNNCWVYDKNDANSLRMRAKCLEEEDKYDARVKARADEYYKNMF